MEMLLSPIEGNIYPKFIIKNCNSYFVGFFVGSHDLINIVRWKSEKRHLLVFTAVFALM